MHRRSLYAAVVCSLLLTGFAGVAFAQPETMAWGNLTGIRINGQLMELNSSMCVVQPGWSDVSRTGRELQTNRYARAGKVETVDIAMRPPRELRSQGVAWYFLATQVVEETGTGAASVNLEYAFEEEAAIEGAYYCFELPAERFSGGSAQLIDPVTPATSRVSLAAGPDEQNEYLRAKAGGLRLSGRDREIELKFSEPTEVIVRDDRRKNNYDLQIYLTVIPGKPVAGWRPRGRCRAR